MQMRIILAGFLLLICLIGIILIGAGSHGNITMENNQTAIVVYGSLILASTALVNFMSLGNGFIVLKTYFSLIFNFVASLILFFILFYMVIINIEGGEFPIWFFIVESIAITLCVIILKSDLQLLLEKKNLKS